MAFRKALGNKQYKKKFRRGKKSNRKNFATARRLMKRGGIRL